jgi:WXXGXW repeat (2 copies)
MRFFRSILVALAFASAGMLAFPLAGSAQMAISVDVPPPPLPIYDQPPIPAPGYIWTPGYWAYDDDYGYYWVPGTWVLVPQEGLLWTPGYWAYEDGNYVYYDGYWGPQVGYYGGIDYGYGYDGEGYEGGYWRAGAFFYNRSVNNISNVTIANVYSRPIAAPAGVARVSFNGGPGGTRVQPTQQQLTFAHAHHVLPTAAQRAHVALAGRDPSLREAENKGRPPIAATSRAQDFKGPGVVAATTAGARPAGQTIPEGRKGEPHRVTQPSEGHTPEKPAATGSEGNPAGAPSKPIMNEHGKKNAVGSPAAHPVPPHPAMQHMQMKMRETQPRTQMQEAQPRPAMQPHPQVQPHPAMQPHPATAPHPPQMTQMTQRPPAPPHPQGQPHPAGGHPADNNPPGQP